MAAKTTERDRAYVPIDPSKLTPAQRELWKICQMDDPPPNGLTREQAENHFRYVCEFDGVPLD